MLKTTNQAATMASTLLGKLALVTGNHFPKQHNTSKFLPILISGAGSGIGRATCQVLAREGANVIAADKNLNSAKETVDSLESKSVDHLGLKVDVESSESIKGALKKVLEVFERPPSIIVNSAGITRDNFLLKLSEKDFDEVVNVNLKVNKAVKFK